MHHREVFPSPETDSIFIALSQSEALTERDPAAEIPSKPGFPPPGAMELERRRILPLDTIYPTSEADRITESRKSLFRNTLI